MERGFSSAESSALSDRKYSVQIWDTCVLFESILLLHHVSEGNIVFTNYFIALVTSYFTN